MNGLEFDYTQGIKTYLETEYTLNMHPSYSVQDDDLKKGDLVTTYDDKIGLVLQYYYSALSLEETYEVLIGDQKRRYPRHSLKKIKKKLDNT